MEHSSKIALMQEKVKLTMRADVYRNRAKYYLELLNHVNHLTKADEIITEDTISLTINHFGHENPADSFFIDADLIIDLLKIQAHRYWHRHDNCMQAIVKIDKALQYEN